MAINFPGSPTNNQTFTSGGITWIYSTAIGAWKIVPNTITGTQGVQGFQGIQGISNQGVQGSQGRQGIQGIQGTSVQGLSGTTQGIQGIQGSQGTSVQGTFGFQGVQGALATATSINATDDTTTTTLYPVMVGAAGSAQTAKVTTPKLTFNASTGSLNATDIVTSTIAPGFTVRKQNTSGEGGEFYLQKSDTSTLNGDLVIDINGNSLRIFENASPYKGVYVDIGTQGSQSLLLTASNYNSYAPTLTGGGASGTWGINVSGTATNQSGGTVNATTGAFSGTMTLPCNVGSAYIKAGTGDGASFSQYNLKINSHWGIGFGDYQDLSTVKAYLNTREGSWGLSGSLGVGTASSGTNGEIRATDNITAYYSDRRLKYNIKIIEDALSKVNQISGVTFQSNEEAAKYGYTDTKTQVGVIAQEIEAVLPEVVVPAPFDIGQNEDGTEYSKSGQNYKTVQYEKIVPLLIEAIKEMSTKIDNLEGQIEVLKNK